jgi:S1-C subfamily serine protease
MCGLVLSAQAQAPSGQHNVQQDCGGIGVQVRPITPDFAASLGMAAPYGAIFDRPEPESAAAIAGIQEGDVVTSVNGTAIAQAADFTAMISQLAPGSLVSLVTYRNGQLIEFRLVATSSTCPTDGAKNS